MLMMLHPVIHKPSIYRGFIESWGQRVNNEYHSKQTEGKSSREQENTFTPLTPDTQSRNVSVHKKGQRNLTWLSIPRREVSEHRNRWLLSAGG